MSLLVELPDDALRNVASQLSAPDLLSFLSSHPHLFQLSKSEAFWRSLMDHDTTTTTLLQQTSNDDEGFEAARQAYLTRAYVNTLPVVQWKACRSSRTSPTGREGHMACTIGTKLIITGGFTDDERIYSLDTHNGTAALPANVTDWQRIDPTEVKSWRHSELPPPHPALFRHEGATELSSVYGATLTPLDNHRAVRFGGFRAGGYSAECNEIALLTLSENNDTTNNNNEVSATWQVIHAKNHCAPRAYHTATLVAQRYLVIIGGMCESGCIRSEAILDTQSWTWLNGDTSVTQEMKLPKPTGRHGHSAVLDDKRDRIVVFGGGSGSDLLRSGRDNAEVWELRMGRQWKKAQHSLQELQESLPWEWSPVLMNEGDDDDENVDEDGVHQQRMVEAMHGSLQDIDDDDDDDDDVEDFVSAHSENSNDELPPQPARDDSHAARDRTRRAAQEAHVPAPNPRQLSEVEKLCLGRCHLGFKVGQDTVLFAFGSGRPSTNGTIGFNLATNSFIRPRQGTNSWLPPPRFTCAGTIFGEYNSYLLVHGGYSTQEGMAVGNMSVLDLAPALRRQFTALPDNPGLQASPPVTQQDVNRHSMFGGHHFGFGGHMGIGGRRQVGRPPVNPPRGVAVARGDLDGERNLGELLGLLAGRRGRDVDEDDDDDESEMGDLEEDDDDEEVPDVGPGMLFDMFLGRDEEEEEGDDSSYDSGNISEVS